MTINAKQAEYLVQQLNVLVVDDNAFMRNMVRGLLGSIGVKKTLEACDGIAALEMIRQATPDIVVLDWEMPLLNGPELVRIVRSPGVFPRPNLPIIMLTSRGHRSTVLQALRAGVHEFLVKPTSPKALRDRLTSIAIKPRPMVKIGDYYVPEPRRMPASFEVERIA